LEKGLPLNKRRGMRTSYRTTFLIEGVLFMILGLLAIIFPGISTLGFELFLGWLFLFSGIIQTYRAYTMRHAPGLLGASLSALFSIVLGLLLLVYPLSGIISLTILLIAFFILEGIAKIIWGIQYHSRLPSWGWLIFSGVISLAMAFIIWSGWPTTALWVIGLLIGINMLFFGASLLGIGFALPKSNFPDQRT
jgi:uncharacterized membrane protein HdeD (DUF308 family)